MFLLCIISVLCGQYWLFTCLCSEQDSPEKSHHQLPQPFDPQPPQLFNITFKLLFTRSQWIDLKVWLTPLAYFILFFFGLSSKLHSSIIYLSAKLMFKVFVIVNLYMCGCFVFDVLYLVSVNCTKLRVSFCHPMERISSIESTYVRCIC